MAAEYPNNNAGSNPLHPLRVLLIDYHADYLGAMFEGVLKDFYQPLTVQQCTTQSSGLEELARVPADVIFCGVKGNCVGTNIAHEKPWDAIPLRDYVARLRSIQPDVKIIVYSGFPDYSPVARELGCEFLAKPTGHLDNIVELTRRVLTQH